MFTFRQVGSVLWTFVGFMVAAAVVLNMRYKTLDEADTLFLDTWTGKVQRVVVETPAPQAKERIATSPPRRSGVDILLLERLAEIRARAQEPERGCAKVRFAFPAPNSRRPR